MRVMHTLSLVVCHCVRGRVCVSLYVSNLKMRGSESKRNLWIIFRFFFSDTIYERLCGFVWNTQRRRDFQGEKKPQKIMKYGLRQILSYYVLVPLIFRQNDIKSTIYYNFPSIKQLFFFCSMAGQRTQWLTPPPWFCI